MDIYAIMGQSNAVGGAEIATLSPANAYLAAAEPGVKIADWLHCQTYGSPCLIEMVWRDLAGHPAQLDPTGPNLYMGVELTLGRRLMARYGSGQIRLVVHASGSTSLVNDWNPDAVSGMRLYSRARADIQSLATATGGTVRGIAWIQGNVDAGALANATGYADRLAHLIDTIRTDFGAETRFVFDQLTPLSGSVYKAELRASQADVASRPAYQRTVRMIPTEGLGLRDGDTHYTADASAELGERFAAQFLAIVDGTTGRRPGIRCGLK